ncbi:hypothetical protein [Paraburkholderia sp. J8-2]|uniref:hypothetical protein n=1 Tax=Paraburkholderia sp. J8-2 TaxID=2805440 RepID=UPI002AB7E16C|nr:hypothetical protein [Paraburkholderia sp. J8-2]
MVKKSKKVHQQVEQSELIFQAPSPEPALSTFEAARQLLDRSAPEPTKTVSLNIPMQVYVDLQVLARFGHTTMKDVIVNATAPEAKRMVDQLEGGDDLRRIVANIYGYKGQVG